MSLILMVSFFFWFFLPSSLFLWIWTRQAVFYKLSTVKYLRFNTGCFWTLQATKILIWYFLPFTSTYCWHISGHGLKANTFMCLYQVNQIRDSLAIMGDNSTAFSLPQVWVFPLVFSPTFLDFNCYYYTGYHLVVVWFVFCEHWNTTPSLALICSCSPSQNLCLLSDLILL